MAFGRFHEGGAITERLIASPPSDPEVRWLALDAQSLYLENIGRFDEARRFADQAYRAAPDAKTRSAALILRGLSNLFGGHTAEAVSDHAEATALARQVHDDPAFLAGALALEAQPFISARLFDEAAARLNETLAVGSPVDANALYNLGTQIGDLRSWLDGQQTRSSPTRGHWSKRCRQHNDSDHSGPAGRR